MSIAKMISAAIENDAVSFREHFDSVMKVKAQTKIDEKYNEMFGIEVAEENIDDNEE